MHRKKRQVAGPDASRLQIVSGPRYRNRIGTAVAIVLAYRYDRCYRDDFRSAPARTRCYRRDPPETPPAPQMSRLIIGAPLTTDSGQCRTEFPSHRRAEAVGNGSRFDSICELSNGDLFRRGSKSAGSGGGGRMDAAAARHGPALKIIRAREETKYEYSKSIIL
ncbi:hypothetical protein EVAR_93905_1 [Eumeta japonica]|uniref:Uncharacterized protein n=1 Tax=Eumeta variegata TaxID=151549 RepID=A0A4C1TP16_EUMVA|nr:hypothetical protein EVAR_93905_1 [Eumeta japonica]